MVCVEGLTGAALEDGHCQASKPETQRACTSAVGEAGLPCPVVDTSQQQGWSMCTEPCEGGTQHRLLKCIEGAAIGTADLRNVTNGFGFGSA